MTTPLPASECERTRDPKTMTSAEFGALGHIPMPILKAIRAKCLNCSEGVPSEVRLCPVVTCALWPYRMGTNPFYGKGHSTSEARE